jgi:Flp pilus assembly pilin Flp
MSKNPQSSTRIEDGLFLAIITAAVIANLGDLNKVWTKPINIPSQGTKAVTIK